MQLDTPLTELDKTPKTPGHGTRHPQLDKSPPIRQGGCLVDAHPEGDEAESETPLDRALAAVTQTADDIARRYPTADYAGRSRQKAERNSEHAARRANR